MKHFPFSRIGTEEFKKRGFLVKNTNNILPLITDISYGFLIISLILSLIYLSSYIINISVPILILFGGIIFIIGLITFISTSILYAKSSKTFYTSNGIINFGKVYESEFELQQDRNQMFLFIRLTKWMIGILEKLHIKEVKDGFSLLIFILVLFDLLLGILIGNKLSPIFTMGELGRDLGIFLSPIPLILITNILTKLFINHFHPLYAFGNLGEKIQKLTPEIEKESKIIQVEFERDQNFSVLHSGFEKLSSTFSEIVELVVKLERVEKRANKGNLFDSEKYINSLRGDIVNPLVELKRFLEKQREQLVESQRELSRVRVGGSEEGGNKELSSKRSEIILGELDENIERLGEMIGKMG